MSRRIVPALMLAALLAGCGGGGRPFAVDYEQVAPDQPEYSVEVLQAQTAPGEPVVLRLKLVNNTSHRLSLAACGALVPMGAILLDPTLAAVRYEWPPLYAICDAFMVVGPGESAEWTREFKGVLYTSSGVPYSATSGRYTMVSVVHYGQDWEGGELTVEDSVSFDWEAP